MKSEHGYFRDLLRKPGVKIALLGATNDASKYGNIIFKNLRQKGYLVYPVNARAKTIDGEAAYPSLSMLPKKPDIINFVLPAKLGLQALHEALQLELDNFWFQPGAESQEIIALLEKSGKHYLADGSCIMVMSLPGSPLE